MAVALSLRNDNLQPDSRREGVDEKREREEKAKQAAAKDAKGDKVNTFQLAVAILYSM